MTRSLSRRQDKKRKKGKKKKATKEKESQKSKSKKSTKEKSGKKNGKADFKELDMVGINNTKLDARVELGNTHSLAKDDVLSVVRYLQFYFHFLLFYSVLLLC